MFPLLSGVVGRNYRGGNSVLEQYSIAFYRHALPNAKAHGKPPLEIHFHMYMFRNKKIYCMSKTLRSLCYISNKIPCISLLYLYSNNTFVINHELKCMYPPLMGKG